MPLWAVEVESTPLPWHDRQTFLPLVFEPVCFFFAFPLYPPLCIRHLVCKRDKQIHIVSLFDARSANREGALPATLPGEQHAVVLIGSLNLG